jgi:uncharacterized protein (TIGR03086 family)
MDVAPLEESINCTRQVLEAVTAEQLGAPTPCASWAVSDVIEHMIGSQLYFAAAMRGQEPVRSRQPVAADNFLALYDEAAAASLAAFTAPGAGERVLHLPFGDLPGAGAVRLAATDTFVHGWDVAAATGQPTDLAPELAARLLEDARPAVPDALRGPDGQAAFGPEQPAPPGASNADRLAAFLGRST